MAVENIADLVPVLGPHFPRRLTFFTAGVMTPSSEPGHWEIPLTHTASGRRPFTLMLRWDGHLKLKGYIHIDNVVPAPYAAMLDYKLKEISVLLPPATEGRSYSLEVGIDNKTSTSTLVQLSFWLHMSPSLEAVFVSGRPFSDFQKDLFFGWLDPYMNRMSVYGALIYNLHNELKNKTSSLS
ncbi:MAG: hypothetical protein AB202_00915 [Parcubacteria bacterium C7867-007]|nr:MAG: hypothetical protein AB202_00915 [Parcubacteria bacterium C7867-007]